MGRKRKAGPSEPIEPVRYGIENQPWARFTGALPGVRLLTAFLARRKQGLRTPSLWEGLLMTLIGGLTLIVIIGGVFLLFLAAAALIRLAS